MNKYAKVKSKGLQRLYEMLKLSKRKRQYRYVGCLVTEYNTAIYDILNSNINLKHFFLLICRNEYVNRIKNSCTNLSSDEKLRLIRYIKEVHSARFHDAKR